jgi:hypothetical protein
VATRSGRFRNFEPGTFQEERFALVEKAVEAHKKSYLSDVETVSRTAPKDIISGRKKRSSYDEQIELLFGKKKRPSPVERILLEGGATKEEIGAARISSGRMEEILNSYLTKKNVAVFSGEQQLIDAIRAAGATASEAEEIIARRGFRNIGGRSMQSVPVAGGKGIFIAGEDQLSRLWKQATGKDLASAKHRQLLIKGHEVTEQFLAAQAIAGKAIADRIGGHRDISIFSADIELASYLGRDSVEQQIIRHQKELPKIMRKARRIRDPKKKARATRKLASLPNVYEKMLRRAGYAEEEITSLVSPIREITSVFPGKKGPLRRRQRPVPRKGTIAALRRKSGRFEEFFNQFESESLLIASGDRGKSSFSKWVGQGKLEKGSAVWAVSYGRTPAGKVTTEWKGFYLNYKGKEHTIDFSDRDAARKLEDLELRVATDVGDEKIISKIERKRRAKLFHQAGNQAAVDSPRSATHKRGARRVVDQAKAKGALGVNEFPLPPVLEKYVKGGVRELETARKMSYFRRAVPYGAAILAGADVLASRDKTGPFWGLVGATAAAALGVVMRKKVSRDMRLLSTIGAYIGGRTIGSALSSSRDVSHQPEISGFDEYGEAAIGRKQLTEFGSGWAGLKKAFGAVGRIFRANDAKKAGAFALSDSVYKRISPLFPTGTDLDALQEKFSKVTKEQVRRSFEGSSGKRSLNEQPKFRKWKESDIWNHPPINRRVSFSDSPTPVSRPTVGSSFAHSGEQVRAAEGKTNIITERKLSKTESSVESYARSKLSAFLSDPRRSSVAAHKPMVLESFKKIGMAGHLRKRNTLDFGTGWDPARRLGRLLFGSAAREGIESASRIRKAGRGLKNAARVLLGGRAEPLQGDDFINFLKNEEFQEALRGGAVIGELGEGGYGKVELMETTFRGKKFKYARKKYDSIEGVESIIESEASTLRTMQDSIAITPYGSGRVVENGKEFHVMYMEAIEGATRGQEAITAAGGLTSSQYQSLESAIGAAHKAGSYHGDLRPANYLIDKKGRLVLIDPAPTRYDALGGGTSKDVGLAHDRLALEAHKTGIIGKPGTTKRTGSRIKQVTDTLTNAIAEAGSPLPGLSPKRRVQHLRSAAGIFLEAGDPYMAESFGIPLGIREEMAEMRKSGRSFIREQILQKPPRAQVSAARNAANIEQIQNKAERVRGRESLHEAAVRTARTNNIGPTRRHARGGPEPGVPTLDMATTRRR